MKQRTIWVALTLLILFLSTTTATAAELISQTIYRVPAGETIADDLYITASEVYIDGTVDGDLIVAASYVEINGTITGDVLLAAVGAKISGEIGDTARMAVGGLEVSGRIGGDLAILAGGGTMRPVPMTIGNQQVAQGFTLSEEGEIGGTLLFSVGTAVLRGHVGEDILGTATALTLAGAVGGDAAVEATLLVIEPAARIVGTFGYTAPQTAVVPEGMASDIQYTPIGSAEASNLLGQTLLRLVGAMAGFALLGWALLTYAPYLIHKPLYTIAHQPIQSVWTGFLVGLVFLLIPIATVLIASGVGVFWGTLSALVVGLFIMCALGVVWIFSPLIVALWIGLRFNSHLLTALLVGLLIVMPLLQFPLLGGILSALCFFLVLGGLLRPLPEEPAPAMSNGQ